MEEDPKEKTNLPPEEPPEIDPSEASAGSVKDITPGWWEMLLAEGQRTAEDPQPPIVPPDELLADSPPEEHFGTSLEEFDFDSEQVIDSLWDLAPELLWIAEKEPKPALVPPEEIQPEPVNLLPPAEDYSPVVPPVESGPDVRREVSDLAEDYTEASEGSIWDIVPSWFKVLSEDPPKETPPETIIPVIQPQDADDEWVSMVPPLSDPAFETDRDSLWDYAPDLQSHLPTAEEAAEDQRVQYFSDGMELYPRELPEVQDTPALVEPDTVEDFPEIAAGEYSPEAMEILTAEPDSPAGGSISQSSPASEEGQETVEPVLNSVWEAVPSWWRVYAGNMEAPEPEPEPEVDDRIHYFDYESLEEDDHPLRTAQESARMAGEGEGFLSPEMLKYLEETEDKIAAEQEALDTDPERLTPAAAAATGVPIEVELDLPADLQAELEQSTAAKPHRSARSFLVMAGTAVVAVLLLLWVGGDALVRWGRELWLASQAAAPVEVSQQLFVNTQAEFPNEPFDAQAKPIGLELRAGVVFALQEGRLVDGRWDPQGPEWLPGAYLVKVIAIPWFDEYQMLLDELQPGDPVRLAMSNRMIEGYRIREILLSPRDRTDFLRDQKLSLVVVFSRPDDADRWVILLDRVP